MRRRTLVREIELADGIHPVTGCEGYAAARLLVRLHGRPVGWLVLRTEGAPVLSPLELRLRMAEELGWDIVRATLARRLAPPPPPAATKISVVVCTRDRTALLRRCLQALLSLEGEDHEILVVDNAPSSEETAHLVAGLPVRYVREDRPGLDWARNRGLAEARHPIVAYTDDDAVVDPGWLRALARAFADPGVAGVTGLVVPLELESEAQNWFELRYGGMGKGLIPRTFVPSDLTPEALLATHHAGVGANMAFRRDVLQALDGFDPALDVGTPAQGGGDLDLFHRLLAAGHALRYASDALVWHQHRRTMPELWRQLYQDGRSFGVYLMKCCHSPGVRRRDVLRFALRRWVPWLVGRCLLGLLGRGALPQPLLHASLRGALTAPLAYRRAYRRDAQVRAVKT
ncbi:MAG TPA: glycosyltransferase [Candidatus Polarisedimenticolaceae bacterium]|nr:glycosyltransferase [Candidatus Polarisedimenticolaceae bacterium]